MSSAITARHVLSPQAKSNGSVRPHDRGKAVVSRQMEPSQVGRNAKACPVMGQDHNCGGIDFAVRGNLRKFTLNLTISKHTSGTYPVDYSRA